MLSLDELRAARKAYHPRARGWVYFLWCGDEMKYVGKTSTLSQRLLVHWSSGRRFDAVTSIECAEEDMASVEIEYLTKYLPEWNDCHRARKMKGLMNKYMGRGRPPRPVQTPKGSFASVTLAAKAFGVTRQAVWYRAGLGKNGWGFLTD